MISVRRAGRLDAREMADLLNPIILEGGTTAHTEPVTRETILHWMQRDPDRAAWFVAETANGEIKGFQFIEPHASLDSDVGDIATFVAIGETGLGIGSKLFEHTKSAARELGYRWINATIRADNSSGLIYYQSRGFEDHAFHPNVALADGRIVDRISKRFDLR